MNLEETKEYLKNNGWKSDLPGIRKQSHYFKRFDTPTRCCCNDRKAGMQVVCEIWTYKGRTSVEFNLRGELSNGSWVDFKLYSMPDNIEEAVKRIPTLLRSWEAANAE